MQPPCSKAFPNLPFGRHLPATVAPRQLWAGPGGVEVLAAGGRGCSFMGLLAQSEALPAPFLLTDVQLHHRAGPPSQERQFSQTAAAATERCGEAHEEQ